MPQKDDECDDEFSSQKLAVQYILVNGCLKLLLFNVCNVGFGFESNQTTAWGPNVAF